MRHKQKTLCKWKKSERQQDMAKLIWIVRKPRFICESCGRVARKKRWLCSPVKT